MGVLAALRAGLGDDVVAAEVDSRHRRDWMIAAAPDARPRALVRPRTTEQVSAILRICHAHRCPVVPQGGLTGLTGGATPVAGCVVLSLERMRAIEEVDADAGTITVQAGATLQAVQEAAGAAGLLYPLDIGGRGSCLIGGNISTNAGGNRVLRYGMTRDLVLGLEVVLADGTVLSALNRMLKNNTGYDLKQLFIGAEGTLGVVTRAVLRLHPKPRSVCTALCALDGYEKVRSFLAMARARLGGSLSAFEVMWPEFYRLATEAQNRRAPLPGGHGAYVLLESMGTDQTPDEAQFTKLVEDALEDGVLADAVVAHSIQQTRELWGIRDSSGDFPRTFWPHVGFDVSIPTGHIGDFAAECETRLRRRWPEVRLVLFGHIADSNLHIGVKVGAGEQPEHAIEEIVYACVRDWHGSISAEHGIGLLKKPYLGYSRSAAEIDVMRRIKAALDPEGILNPGKIF